MQNWGFFCKIGKIWGNLFWQNRKGFIMRKKNYKGRCTKTTASKSKTVCRTYDDIAFNYLKVLETNEFITEIKCNVPINLSELGEYTTDFVCVKNDGDLLVRECVYRRLISRPSTIKLLDASREHWLKRGVTDWGIVINEKE